MPAFELSTCGTTYACTTVGPWRIRWQAWCLPSEFGQGQIDLFQVMPRPEIYFDAKIDKIIEVILYLAHCPGIELTRYRVIKLVYLADVLHLNRYGRPITFDNMLAMKNGPVPSTTYNILKQDRRYSIDYRKLPFDFIQRGDRHYVENPKRTVNTRLFSKSDLIVLEETVKEHGQKTFRQLYDLTHQHTGYIKAWKKRRGGHSHPIRFEDLLEESESKAGLVEDMRATCRHVF